MPQIIDKKPQPSSKPVRNCKIADYSTYSLYRMPSYGIFIKSISANKTNIFVVLKKHAFDMKLCQDEDLCNGIVVMKSIICHLNLFDQMIHPQNYGKT